MSLTAPLLPANRSALLGGSASRCGRGISAPGWRRRENLGGGSLIALSQAWICFVSPLLAVGSPATRPRQSRRAVCRLHARYGAPRHCEAARNSGSARRGARRWQLVAAPAAAAAAAERLLPPCLWLRLCLQPGNSTATATSPPDVWCGATAGCCTELSCAVLEVRRSLGSLPRFPPPLSNRA